MDDNRELTWTYLQRVGTALHPGTTVHGIAARVYTNATAVRNQQWASNLFLFSTRIAGILNALSGGCDFHRYRAV